MPRKPPPIEHGDPRCFTERHCRLPECREAHQIQQRQRTLDKAAAGARGGQASAARHRADGRQILGPTRQNPNRGRRKPASPTPSGRQPDADKLPNQLYGAADSITLDDLLAPPWWLAGKPDRPTPVVSYTPDQSIADESVPHERTSG